MTLTLRLSSSKWTSTVLPFFGKPFREKNSNFTGTRFSSTSSVPFFDYDTAFDNDLALYDGTIDTKSNPISLSEFIKSLPPIFHNQKQLALSSQTQSSRIEALRGTMADPVNQLFSRLDLTRKEWKSYSNIDSTASYSRSLIATDNETFSLLLLCWRPNAESPIHDHPCDGCWVRVCEGSIKETRYDMDEKRDCLQIISEEVLDDTAEVSYINDYMGYHKVGNPSKTIPAVTMHLYSPPYNKCRLWFDPNHASRPSIGHIKFHNS